LGATKRVGNTLYSFVNDKVSPVCLFFLHPWLHASKLEHPGAEFDLFFPRLTRLQGQFAVKVCAVVTTGASSAFGGVSAIIQCAKRLWRAGKLTG
jgi:hypothetical protein